MEGETILRVEGLSKQFGGVKALEDVDFELKKGEFLGVIGPNGSGKTTLLNLITGYVKPDSGKVICRGKDITGLAPYSIANMGISRSFQMVRPFYNLPAYKNLIIPLYSPRVRNLRGGKYGGKYGKRDNVAIDLLEDVGFERDSLVPYKVAGSLPHGYLKRMELARCLALQPDLIMLDEIFSGMSMSEVAATLPIIERLREEGLSIIMVEHRLRELVRIADRLLVLNFGKKIAVGLPHEVIESEAVREAYLGTEREPERIILEPKRKGQTEKTLEVRNLIVFFENAAALNDISLEVRKGEIVGVFGSNSAGKTTLMNTISGLIIDMKKKEDRKGGVRITVFGEVEFEGEKVTKAQPYERVQKGIVLSQERHPVFPDCSGEENLKIGAHLHRGSELKGRLEFVYSIFPTLKELRRRKAGFWSGGEQQMLSIGIALMANPRLLLMDEPLLGLSPALQQDFVRVMRQIREEGITILVAEQFARPFLHMVDRGYVIENSLLVLTGKGQELMDNPEVKAAYFGV